MAAIQILLADVAVSLLSHNRSTLHRTLGVGGGGGRAEQGLQASLQVVGRDDHEAPRGQVSGQERGLQPV